MKLLRMKHGLGEIAASRILDACQGKDKVIMGLCGGRSVEGIFSEFKKSKDPVWKKVHIFITDERDVPLDSPDSNYKLIMDSFATELIKKGILPKQNIHPLQPGKTAAKKYYVELKRMGGIFDILLLSAGENSHVAALHPEHEQLDNCDFDYLYLEDSPKPPAKRTTMSPMLIKQSKFNVLLFIGEGKRQALKDFLDPSITYFDCPAKLADNGSLEVYTDLE